MTFSLRGNSIPNDGSGRVLITDVNPTNEDALICRAEITFLFPTNASYYNWFLDPTERSTRDDDRIVSSSVPADRGWLRNRDFDSGGHQIMRLRRSSATAEEGVFTCYIGDDINGVRALGIYYPSESL